MLDAYSNNIAVNTDAVIPFNNVTIEKGRSAVMTAPGTIQLNQKGVYMVSCNSSGDDTAEIQLYKDGTAQAQAQAVGPNASFTTLVQVPQNNTNCCCTSPTTIQVMNISSATTTYDNVHLCVTKLC